MGPSEPMRASSSARCCSIDDPFSQLGRDRPVNLLGLLVQIATHRVVQVGDH